ncbi:hypothetical protein [Novosphingobium malaysiense]|nr:hypothetical protein [Novosphingobium malaysiense]
MFSRLPGRLRQPSNLLLVSGVAIVLATIGGLAVSRYSIPNAGAAAIPAETKTLDNVSAAGFSPQTRKTLLNIEVNAGILAARLDDGAPNKAAAFDKASLLIAETSRLGDDVPAPLRDVLASTAKSALSQLHAGDTEQAARQLRSIQTTLRGFRMQ